MPLFGELFVSEMLGKPVLDPAGEELGTLKDMVIVKGSPLPRIDALIIERKKQYTRLSWSEVSLFNKRIISTSLKVSALDPYGFPEDELLVARDLLDKQIVDANGARLVRVNDIKLEGYEADAVLLAVDIGVRGLLRRFGLERRGAQILGLFRGHIPANLISWNYIQPLQPKLSTIGLTVPRQMMEELHPADLADILSQVTPSEGAEFIKNLDNETAADALSELEPATQTAMLRDMGAERAADIIEEMPPDDAADVINMLPEEHAKEILENLEREDAEDIQELLSHESDTAGGLMTTDFISYQPEVTVGQFMEKFRKEADEIESVYYVYIIDSEERLLGVVSLKEVILADQEERLGNIMETNLKTVRPEVDEMEVAALISKYGLLALPVVDCDTCMLGIVTVDDVLNRLLPRPARRKRGRV